MRNLLILVIAVFLVVPLVSAEYTETWEVETTSITVGEPRTSGVPWTAELVWVNQTTQSLQGDHVGEPAFSRDGDQYVVKFNGTILADSPCQGIEPWVRGEDGEYVYRIENTEAVGDCPEATTLVQYEAMFHVDEPFTINILHENTLMDRMEHPATEHVDEEPTDTVSEDTGGETQNTNDADLVDPSDVEYDDEQIRDRSMFNNFVDWLRDLL